MNDEPRRTSVTASPRAAETDTQPDRRRPGRINKVEPALIPLLRGEFPPGLERMEEPVAATHRKACAACQEARPVFPFSVAFQPVVDLEEGRIDAYEALVRGPAAEGARFVLDQVTSENLYAFDQACRVKAIETAARLGIDRQLNINFLPNAVYEPRACIQTTLRTAARTGFPLNRLTFEIVEAETVTDNKRLLDIIAEYHRHGFLIALDDFGTGYSGLSRLIELQPDIVKVDRVVIQDCNTDPRRRAVVAGLVAMARELGVKLVVEGVERAEEVASLRAAGVRYMQGFYFAKPAFEAVASDSDVQWPVGLATASPRA